LNHIITKAFYSLKDTVTPVRVSVIMVGINVVLDLLLVRYMSFGGLALATSIVAVLNFVFLYLFFKKKHSILEGDRTIKPWTEKVLLLNVAFGLLCFLMLGFFQGIHHNLILIGFYLLVVFALSLFYIILSFFLGINEGKAVLSFIVKRIRRKAWGGDVVE
ncbi:MAG: lipid II flippase MurJ, partial [Atribacterota bacterium]